MTTTYEGYIHPHRLPPVEPLEHSKGDPDEQFFIRTHQTFEVWFAQILAELEYARFKLSTYVEENDVPPITQHVQRAALIFDLLRDHLPLLESLLTTSFFDFRRQLFGAGGIESYRFREIEWLLGFREQSLIEYTNVKLRSDEQNEYLIQELGVLENYQSRAKSQIRDVNSKSRATRRALRDRELDLQSNGTLRYSALAWLQRTPFPAPGGQTGPGPEFSGEFTRRFTGRFWEEYQEDCRRLNQEADTLARTRLGDYLQEQHRQAILFVLQFADQPLLTWPATLLEALLELDQAFLNWRNRHIAMVARVIGGGRISTFGQSGSGLTYLQGTLGKKAFPEIWDARSFLLGNQESKELYALDEWKPYRLAFELK